MKKVAATLFLTDDHQFLIGHVTDQPIWSLIKGVIEPLETPLEACLRESYEETGLIINPKDLIDKGTATYISGKDLHFFLYRVKTLPPLKSLFCRSTFVNHKGIEKPEIDDYRYVMLDSAEQVLQPNMFRAAQKVGLLK